MSSSLKMLELFWKLFESLLLLVDFTVRVTKCADSNCQAFRSCAALECNLYSLSGQPKKTANFRLESRAVFFCGQRSDFGWLLPRKHCSAAMREQHNGQLWCESLSNGRPHSSHKTHHKSPPQNNSLTLLERQPSHRPPPPPPPTTGPMEALPCRPPNKAAQRGANEHWMPAMHQREHIC